MDNKMRLIDANALLDEIRKSKDGHNHTECEILMNHHMEHDVFMDLVDLAPTVDAVEVVRCKDCKLAKKPYTPQLQKLYMICTVSEEIYVKKDGFCCYGERRTDHG